MTAPPSTAHTAHPQPTAGEIGFAQAVDIAGHHLPGATAIYVRLEAAPALRASENYHVHLFRDGAIYDVEVDQQTGQIVDQDVERVDGAHDLARLTTLSSTVRGHTTLRTTAAMAEANYNVDALRQVELEMQDGLLVAEVDLRLGREAVEWQIDPATGQIMNTDRTYVPGS